MKYTKCDFGSIDEKLYDTRVKYMQPAMVGIETQDHIEREFRREVRNLEADPAFYFEGEDVGDVIGLEIKGDEINKPKTTLAQAHANAVNPSAANKARAEASKALAQAASNKAAALRSAASKAKSNAEAAKAKANAKKLHAEKVKAKRDAAYLKIKKVAPQLSGPLEDEAEKTQVELQAAINDANLAVMEADKAIAYASQLSNDAKVATDEEAKAKAIASQDAKLVPASANKPLLVGAVAGIAALMYFNKG